MGFAREILGVIFDSCAGHCYYCGRPQQPFGDWEVDHMTPRQQGGSDELFNLTLACKKCNRKKSNRTVEQFRLLILQRALTGLDEISDLFMEYDQPPGSLVSQINETIIKAYDELLTAKVFFFGELNHIPRKHDPRFTNPEGEET